MILRKAHSLDVGRGLGQLHRTGKFMTVVGFLEKSRLHLTELGVYIRLTQTQDTEGNGLHDT